MSIIIILQDYGPKVNFKRQKVKLGSFNGLPPFSAGLVKRMQQQSEMEELRGFTPVELCNLDYSPERGSAIDPHMDDEWIWGERLVTLNLLSPTYLTFSNNSIECSPSDSHTPRVKVPHTWILVLF
jgi:alkylated DNA repair protein alkB family protein 4